MIASHILQDIATTHISMGRRQAAFTLLELLVSLSISIVLLAGMAGALTVGLRNSRPSKISLADTQSIQLADRILTDLVFSKSFENASTHEVQFTVPGRSGESSDDRILYQWTGKPNFEVRRAINDEPFQTVAKQITFFELDYLTKPPISVDSPAWESPEVMLMEYDSSPGASVNSYSTSLTRFCAQWFKPILHPDTISWKVTRVEIVIRKSAVLTPSQFKVAICDSIPNSTWPVQNALTESTLVTEYLPIQFSWVNVDLPDIGSLSPELGYCLRIAPSLPGMQPRVAFETTTQPKSPRNQWLTSTDSGNSWSTPDTHHSMRFRVFGTMTLQPW